MGRFLASKKKASHWNQCYPLGNGKIGVMDNADPINDTIYLNDSTFWSGDGKDKKLPFGFLYIDKIRQLIEEGKIREAEKYISKYISGKNTQSYLLLATLHTSKGEGNVSSYRRHLDFESGLFSVTYRKKRVDFEEKSFVSYVDDVYVRQITASRESSMYIKFSALVRHKVAVKDNFLIIQGQAPTQVVHPSSEGDKRVLYEGEDGLKFSAICKVETDGVIKRKGKGIEILDYTKVVFYYSAKTQYEYAQSTLRYCELKVEQASQRGFEECFSRSKEDVSRLFNRTKLVINDVSESASDTEKELRSVKRGKDPLNAILTLYDFGRYLMIAGSREGSQALNLQGIWCDTLTPPWSSNYTLNINFQMNYWASLSTGLFECFSPYVEQVKKIASTGEEVARVVFKSDGWCCGHNSDLWGHSNPTKGTSDDSRSYSLCMGAAGWLCQGLFKKYQYTQDFLYLADIFPIIEGAVEFYLSYMRWNKKTNSFECYPDISPENLYKIRQKTLAVDRAPTMSMSIIKELFENYLQMCDLLERDNNIRTRVENAVKFIYPYTIGKEGYLQEWSVDFKENDRHHRHVSHLYGLYSGDSIGKEEGNEFKEAAAITLERRGEGATGWSMAWKTALWARLKNGEKAYKMLKKSVRLKKSDAVGMEGGVYSSMLSAHPPFQIDGNFGVVAAINEMLVQSYKGLDLLPALPKEWKSGFVEGLYLEGNQYVSFEWEDGKIKNVRLNDASEELKSLKINCL